MAHPSFHAQVLTPEGQVYDGEVEQVSTRTGTGEVGILAQHAPMLARLVPAELRLHVSDSETIRYAQGHGWLQVFANEARVLISEAVEIESLDASELRERLSEAEQRLSEAEHDSEAWQQAEQDVARAKAFLAIAEDS
jgi:F-type H+-transporting ATPase subunit epsilon